MPSNAELYERIANAPAVPAGLPLVYLLTGFTDAGGAVSGLIEQLHEVSSLQPIISFDSDHLLDYRARRPIIHFEEDHLTSYSPPRLELSLAHDALGQPFLLLSGYEPDFLWNGFVRAVVDLAEEFGVSSVSWAHAIAMPIPHTRPLGTTVSGNRVELIEARSVWKPRTQVPSTVGHLLEYRFAERNVPVAGFVLLAPHYLADTSFPGAALVAADRLQTATGLVWNLDSLRDANEDYLRRVAEQVSGNEELQQMLRTLEERYDSYMAGRQSEGGDAQFSDPGFSERMLPSADELAAELERYLANRPGDDEQKARRGPSEG